MEESSSHDSMVRTKKELTFCWWMGQLNPVVLPGSPLPSCQSSMSDLFLTRF